VPLSDVLKPSAANAHRTTRTGRFYVIMFAALLLLTVAGFSRTLFL
jgi:hypothetical protein